jgi:hypothetical protein
MQEPDVVFNMDLANGSTSERFCREAADVLEVNDMPVDYDPETCFSEVDEYDAEALDEIVDYWTDRLYQAGYWVRWDAGDVVVWDLRTLTDDEREVFFEEMTA